MKTKILYVVTSSPEDIYLEQTYLSIYTLHKHVKEPHVVLLTDNRTDATLQGNRAKILELVNEKVVVDFDDSVSNMRRSRFLKTSMRNLVDGDFLFIDGDTIINTSIEDIDDCNFSFGAVSDAHRDINDHYGKEHLKRQVKTLGFSLEGEKHYFNSGVMYIKDTSETRDFFKKWNDNWKSSVEKGINQDQPALLKTNIEMGHFIQELNGSWNCQIMYGFNYYSTAKIIHYFASKFTTNNGGYTYEFVDPKILKEFKKRWEVSEELERKLDNPLTCFSPQCELIGGTDVDILNTHVYKTIRLIHNKAPKLFAFLQSVLYYINKLNKSRNE